MGIEEILKSKREDILKIASRHGVRQVYVFGSVARGDASPDSDIDFLVEVGPTRSSWFPAGLIVELEDLLERKVEVITRESLPI
jgi:predicted nucleotidyltransferase